MDAEKLREIRTLHKLSQTAFGARIKATQAQITAWERDLHRIPMWAAENIKREFRFVDKNFTVRGRPDPYPRVDKENRKILLEAEELLDEADEEIKDNLKRLIRLMRRIPKTPSKRAVGKG